MKKLLPRYFIQMCFILLAGTPLAAQNHGFDTGRLGKSVHRIQTIDPADPSYRDLNFLKKTLKNADMVFLGEQSHGDGSTFEAKSRLVQFLHQEMNFDVLAFESSLTDCSLMWKKVQKGADPLEVGEQGIFKFWAGSHFTAQLFGYIRDEALGSDPLILAGFDLQPSALFPPEERKEILIRFLEAGPEEIRISRLPHLEEYLSAPQRFFLPKTMIQVDSAYRSALLDEFRRVAAAWEAKPWNQDEAPLYRYFVNIPRWLWFFWNLDFDHMDPAIANIRDEEMAKNLIWLKEQIYPGKKIIVWGASSHFGFNRTLLQPYDSMIPMGQRVKNHFGNRGYVISFTSFDGQTGSIYSREPENVPPADSLSLEFSLHKTGVTQGFLDLRKRKVKEILGDRFRARLYGYENWSGEWARMTDGIFYINTMEPNRLRDKQ